MTAAYRKFLEEQGYFSLREIEGRGICGLCKYLYTIAIVYGLDDSGYQGRWCYSNVLEAAVALHEWNGVGDPPYDWIKYKGNGGERSRVPDSYDEKIS